MAQVKVLREKATALPTAQYVQVTPQMAQRWLDEAAPNRNVVQRKVDQYADMMTRGDWMVSSQGIAFSSQGKLLDGQHRLLAIVQSGVSVALLVTTDVSARAQLIMDQGQMRRPHDQIKLRQGFEVLPVHVAVAKAMLRSVGGPGLKDREKMITDIQLMDRYYLKHHKAIEFAVGSYFGKSSIRGITIAPVFAPVARAYYSYDHDLLNQFVRVVVTGMAESAKEGAAVVLRNWLIAGRDKMLSARAGKDRNTIYLKAEVALKAFIEGRKIERLGQMTTTEELFPLPGEK